MTQYKVSTVVNNMSNTSIYAGYLSKSNFVMNCLTSTATYIYTKFVFRLKNSGHFQFIYFYSPSLSILEKKVTKTVSPVRR